VIKNRAWSANNVVYKLYALQEICGTIPNVRDGNHNPQYTYEDECEIIKFKEALCCRRISKYC
jgi:hypothetical protein